MALGNIATEATYYSMDQLHRSLAEKETSLKRWGKPEEVAKITAHLASDDFSYSTGNTIIIDGGTLMVWQFFSKIKRWCNYEWYIINK